MEFNTFSQVTTRTRFWFIFNVTLRIYSSVLGRILFFWLTTIFHLFPLTSSLRGVKIVKDSVTLFFCFCFSKFFFHSASRGHPSHTWKCTPRAADWPRGLQAQRYLCVCTHGQRKDSCFCHTCPTGERPQAKMNNSLTLRVLVLSFYNRNTFLSKFWIKESRLQDVISASGKTCSCWCETLTRKSVPVPIKSAPVI